MATIKYSNLTFPASFAFTITDVLSFDMDSISANDITSLSTSSGNTTMIIAGNTITLTGFDINLIDKARFVFADGSKLLVGDTTVAVTDGNNTIVSGEFDDYIDGVTGTDTASYSAATSAVTVTLATGTSTGGAGEDKLVNIDNLKGSNYNDNLTGSDAGNQLDGGLGVDTLAGGDGNDTYIVTAGDNVVETSGNGTDLVQSAIDWTLSANVENLTLTGTTAVVGIGNDDVTINTIVGNVAANILDGKAGADDLTGGDGNDTYIVDNSAEVIHEGSTATSGAADWVNSSAATYTLAANVENLRLIGTAVIAATGNSGVNNMIGNNNNSTLDGAAGNDIITDLLGGNDTLIGGDGADTITGGKGNDRLVGNVSVAGTTGDSDADTLNGGTGNDSYYVTDTTDVVNEAANPTTGGSAWVNANNQDEVFASVTYALNDAASVGVDRLTLTGTAAINGTGNTIDNIIKGNAGVNILNGGKGADTIHGETATAAEGDTLIGGDGADILTGGTGADTLIGNTAIGDAVGDGDIDTMDGGAGNDTYYVSDTTDTASEIGANAAANGTDEVKSIANYTISAFIENLTLMGAGTINGTGNDETNIITGNAGNNTLIGGLGADTLNGGAGNDILIGKTATGDTTGDGAIDTMNGGAGNDTYYVTDDTDTAAETGVTAATNGIDLVNSTVNFTISTNIENLTLNGSNAVNGTGNATTNTITGNGENNTLIGLAGNDSLLGGAGDDLLVGGENDNTPAGASAIDTLTGGDGEDSYVIDSISDVVKETNVTGDGSEDDTVFLNILSGAATYTLTTNVENLVLGGHTGTVGTPLATTNALNGTGNAFVNSITGNDGANTLIGGDLGDTLTGGDGNDILIGGINITTADGDNDTLIGGAGNDKYYVTETGDVAKEAALATSLPDQLTIDSTLDTVFATLASGTYTINDSSIENLTLLGTFASSATGNASANILTGNSAVNTLNGNDGNDKLDGQGGADTMLGGVGDDTYVVDNTSDVVAESLLITNGVDLVQASATYTISDKDVENLTLTGATAINGTGNSSANVITGNSASNILSGSTGDDTLNGMGGKDTLTGGDDVDTFVFSLAADSANLTFDVITDFSFGGTDVIDLNAIDADTLTGGDQAFTLHSLGTVVTAPTVLTAANQIDYYVNGGNTFLIGDTDGILTTIEFKVQLTGFVDPLDSTALTGNIVL